MSELLSVPQEKQAATDACTVAFAVAAADTSECQVGGVEKPVHHVDGKWLFLFQTMIEAHVDVKTTDGYLLRLFCVGFTKKRNNQIRKTSYAQHQQVRQIRKKMMEIMTREVQTNDLKEVVNKL